MTTRPTMLRILAAGSLRHALPGLAALLPDIDIAIEPGPAGLLRRRIEAGAACDLFLSANLAHPRALAGGAAVPVFARNRLVALALAERGYAEAGLLALLRRDDIRIGTSTPGADPGGDYAQAVLARVDAIYPGAGAVARARHLVGGPDAPAVPPGADPQRHFLESGAVDLFLSYRSGALRLAPPLAMLALPAEIAVTAEYGLAVLAREPAAREAAMRFAALLLGPEGQVVLARAGFEPPG